LGRLLAGQDYVLHRDQAVAAGMSRSALRHRFATGWRPLLPGVYLTHPGEPSRRQRLVAGLLYAGPDAAIDSVDACHFYGLKATRPDETLIHVAVHRTSPVRSVHWLVVRHSSAAFAVRSTELLRYVDPATAVIAATRLMSSRRAVLAVLSDASQRGIADVADLVAANHRGPRRNAAMAREALVQLDAGVRSVAEARFRGLAEAAPGLPRLMYNPLIRLPDGSRIRPDALAPDAPLIHETNGAIAHRRQDLFEDMQRRHDALTAAGFTVLHNTPRRIRDDGHRVIREFDQCYRRLAKTGWPDGVVLLDDAQSARSNVPFPQRRCG